MMGKIKKIYLDTNHLIQLLDRQDRQYKQLAELLIHNKDKCKLLVSNFILIEQCNVYRDTLFKRAENAKDIVFSYIRSHKIIIQMELNHHFNGIEIIPETDNYFKVIKLPEPWHLSTKQKKLKFHQLLTVLPEKPLSPPNDLLYSLLNDRCTKRRSFKEFILEYHKNNKMIIAQSNLANVNEFTCPSLFFYFASWSYKDGDSTKVLSRNDAFDSAHCSYIPYADIFVTDRGNAHAGKQALKKFNSSNKKPVQTRIFSKCEELLKEIG